MKESKKYNWQIQCEYCGKTFKRRGMNIHLTKVRFNEDELKRFREERKMPIKKEEILHLSQSK